MHIRFRFAKLGKVRFTSQRDVARMWERALRRAQLPVAYTEGFSPRPRLSFGLALPTGCESEAEYLDVALDEGRTGAREQAVAGLPDVLNPLFPEGVGVREAAWLPPGLGSLQQSVTSCSWTMAVAGVGVDELEAQVAAFLASPSVVVSRERKGRPVEDDIRPAVRSLTVADGSVAAVAEDGGRAGIGLARLEAELATQPRGIRPTELLAALARAQPALGADGPEDRITTGRPVLDRAWRTHQWIERDGIRAEPLEWARRTDANRAGYAWRRAS